MIEKILLTRPAGFNDELAGALAAQGIAVLQAPLVRIQGLDPAGLRLEPKILLDPEQVIIFTSQNAIDYAGDLIPQLAQAAKAHVFAVGPATQMRLKEMGIVATAPDQPGSEPLLSLPAFTAPFDKKVLIVTGRLGRDYLETTLRARGAAVARYECYERVPLLIQNLDCPGLSPYLSHQYRYLASLGESFDRFESASGGIVCDRQENQRGRAFIGIDRGD